MDTKSKKKSIKGNNASSKKTFNRDAKGHFVKAAKTSSPSDNKKNKKKDTSSKASNQEKKCPEPEAYVKAVINFDTASLFKPWEKLWDFSPFNYIVNKAKVVKGFFDNSLNDFVNEVDKIKPNVIEIKGCKYFSEKYMTQKMDEFIKMCLDIVTSPDIGKTTDSVPSKEEPPSSSSQENKTVKSKADVLLAEKWSKIMANVILTTFCVGVGAAGLLGLVYLFKTLCH